MSTVTVIKRKRSSQFRFEQLESDEDREHQEPLNLPEAVGTINHFLNTLEEKNLKLRVEEETFYAYEIESLLKGRRAVYDPQTGVLTVKAMASALHDAVFRFASQFYADIVDLGVLTRQERRCIQVTPESHMLAGTIENAGPM